MTIYNVEITIVDFDSIFCLSCSSK